MDNIEKGTIVTRRGEPGRLMTVQEVNYGNGTAKVIWFENFRPMRAEFSLDVLVPE